jgi:hypothetical protein
MIISKARLISGAVSMIASDSLQGPQAIRTRRQKSQRPIVIRPTFA